MAFKILTEEIVTKNINVNTGIKPEIWVGGYPSFYGGADTELDHNIDLWVKMGLNINLVPMFGNDAKMKENCDKRGCITHNYHKGIFKDKVVASWCNGSFLEKLPEIMESGKPKKVIWFNCMTWMFEKEKVAHSNGWIDYFGFVSEYQKKLLLPQYEKINKNTNIFEGYRPYFNVDRVIFKPQESKEYFGIGRCSRDDPSKFSDDMWKIFDKVCTPNPKKVFVLGYSDKVEKKVGKPPNGVDWMTWTPNSIPVSDLYSKLHCLIHKTGGSRESYCRIVPECYAYGVPIITEDDYAFPELIIDGETGFRCKSSDEMSYRASQLAFDNEKRNMIVTKAKYHLENEISSIDKCKKAWAEI